MNISWLQVFAGSILLFWLLGSKTGGKDAGSVLASLADQAAYTVRTAEGVG